MKSRRLSLAPRSLIVCALLFTLTATAHAGAPKNFDATYKARYMGMSITARRVLETLADGTQQLTFTADSWVGDVLESSQFRWNEEQRIVPLRYEYHRSGLGRDREAILEFDWQTRKVINNVQQKPWAMEIPELALDKLSYQLQIRSDLLNQKPLLKYEIADGGRLKTYHFEVLGEETLKTRAGKFTTIKVKRVREEAEDRQTIFWMAKDWDYLVVRLQQQEDNGSTYEIDLHEATVDGVKVK